ncbi:MAG: phospholipase D-like domain-containing protein, partial [Rickettsiales bacterium]|nr:phospholipase D-like domain-containing protein [Rickettsiales bacterium]
METNFINNVGENTLKNKFLKYANLSDDIKILIGYFFLSGYNKIFSSGVFSKVKILVGLGTEKNIISAVGDELKTIEDVLLNVKSIENFINDLRDGKIEIRQTREENHSKTYIFNFKEGQANERKVILGSSNFSERGLEFRNEMNYEIDNKQDAEWANKHFDKLWDESIILDKDRLLESIKNEIDKSFINPKTPYQVFIKTLHCIFENEKDKFHTPNGYDDVEYQNVAVNRALTILKNYNGVILGDAVGLGKSIIASKICDAMGKARVLALCKPALILQWEKYLKDFYISGDVKSIGKIESISYKEYDVIVIDEAHNFRNDETKRYTELQKICEGKKIILLSATIFNNSLEDIENIIYLFQPRNSKIFGTEPLDSYFKELKRKAKKNEKQTSLFPSSDKFEKLRKDILEKVMIRRTKKEIREQYEEEKIKFPAMQKPINISYEFSDKVKRVFERTIEILKKELHYARYNALGYFNYSGKIKGTECNAASLIRTIFLKRLESSVHAFKETMKRVYDNYQTYCLLVNDNKKVPDDKEIVKEIDSVKDLNKFLEENATKFNDLSGYDDTFVEHLEKDIKLLEELDGLWKNIGEEDDNKIKKFIEKMRANEFSNRFIVFSESSDSVEFIYKSILSTKIYKEDEILCVTGAQIDNKMRKIIDNNFNPKAENPEDKIKVLVATDVLAEGVNLHKCNRLINYDITWNPVRLM